MITKNPTTKTKRLKKLKYDTPGYKNPKLLFGKRERIPRLLKSAAEPSTQGQRYAKISCQMPINEYNKIGRKYNS